MTTPRLPDGARHTMETIAERCIEEGDCLLWQGAMSHGSPTIRSPGRKMLALRAYVFTDLLGNAVPAGKMVTFTCHDNRCVAPDHLKAVTRAELCTMAVERTQYNLRPDRSAKLARAARKRSPHSEETVNMVRSMEGSSREVARSTGLPLTFVTRVRTNQSWVQATPFNGLGARLAANDSTERKRA